MNSLPQSFLVVNQEGVHRCYVSLERVTDFNHLVARFAQHKLLAVKHLAISPYGIVHLVVHSRDGLPIVLLEANKGTMSIQTQYRLINQDATEWLSPCFYDSNEGSFEFRCEFNFKTWSDTGLKMFFAINAFERTIQSWIWWDKQNYRVPLGNVFETGSICLGDKYFDKYFVNPVTQLDQLLIDLSASTWNADAYDIHWNPFVSQLIRFDVKTLQMLPPLKPGSITHLGVMANPTIADVMKLIYG